MALASTGYVVIGREDALTPGTAPLRTEVTNYKLFPAEEAEIDPAKEFIDFREIRGSRQAMVTLDGPFRPTVNMSGPTYPVGVLGLALRGTFGKVTTTGSGTTKTHVFGDADTLPTFTVERADKVSTATIVEYVTGCKVESLQFACAFGEKVDMTLNFQATNKPGRPTADGNGKYPTIFDTDTTNNGITDIAPGNIDPLIFAGAKVYWEELGTDGAAIASGDVIDSANVISTVKSVNLEFNNTLTRQETLNGEDDAYKIFEGGLECTLSAAMVFEDVSMYNRLLNGKPVSIVLSFKSNSIIEGSTKYELQFYWPRVKVSRASIPFTAGEVIESDVEFKVIFDQASGKMVEAKLINNEGTAGDNLSY
jgi:hypothetical protein